MVTPASRALEQLDERRRHHVERADDLQRRQLARLIAPLPCGVVLGVEAELDGRRAVEAPHPLVARGDGVDEGRRAASVAAVVELDGDALLRQLREAAHGARPIAERAVEVDELHPLQARPLDDGVVDRARRREAGVVHRGRGDEDCDERRLRVARPQRLANLELLERLAALHRRVDSGDGHADVLLAPREL
eukprot:scaffold67024_cov48-Phaeocystis_antarctica.AAC.1